MLVVLSRHVGDVSNTEQAMFELFFNTLPDGLLSFFETLYRSGRCGRSCCWPGSRCSADGGASVATCSCRVGLAWGLARVIGELVVEQKSLGKSLSVVTRFGITPSFPLVRLAVLVAVVSVARPYVSAPMRRIGQVIVVVMAAASLYLGTASPNDALAAIVLGWGSRRSCTCSSARPEVDRRPTR